LLKNKCPVAECAFKNGEDNSEITCFCEMLKAIYDYEKNKVDRKYTRNKQN